MKNKLFLILVLPFLSQSAHGYPSLFLKQDKNHQKSNKLSLSSLLYLDSSHWSLWINDEIICPDSSRNIQEFHIEYVGPFEVKFSWIPPHSTEKEHFTLHSHQAFLIDEKKIIDE